MPELGKKGVVGENPVLVDRKEEQTKQIEEAVGWGAPVWWISGSGRDVTPRNRQERR